jgi:hypothetical protein
MTFSKETVDENKKSFSFNRFLYGGFVIMSLYFLFFSRDIGTAMSNLGIALIFDPFDQKVTWSNRPLYQRAWLLIHGCLVLILLGFTLVEKFS